VIDIKTIQETVISIAYAGNYFNFSFKIILAALDEFMTFSTHSVTA